MKANRPVAPTTSKNQKHLLQRNERRKWREKGIERQKRNGKVEATGGENGRDRKYTVREMDDNRAKM